MDSTETNINLESHDVGELLELGKNLIAAARIGDTAAVLEFVTFGAPFATDWWGMTSLHHAALGGHLETCELLVKSGILKDARSKVEKTPLHMACQEGHARVAMFLLANGADIHAADLIFMTALHWAVEMQHIETVQVLLQNGANPMLVNKFEKTCFDIARDNCSDEILTLLQAGNTEGRFTVLRNPDDRVVDIVPKRNFPTINFPPKLIKGRQSIERIFRNKVVPPSPPASKQRIQEMNQENMRQLLEEHGIEMLEEEDPSLVASAVDSGRTVILTEAGRQALSLTQSSKDEIKLAVPNKKESNKDIMAAVSQKYLQAKREAEKLRILYAKKKREVDSYQSELHCIAIKSLKSYKGQPVRKIVYLPLEDSEMYDDDETSSS